MCTNFLVNCPSDESNLDCPMGDGLSADIDPGRANEPMEYDPGDEDMVEGVLTVE